jgi:hypothetical protein
VGVVAEVHSREAQQGVHMCGKRLLCHNCH